MQVSMDKKYRTRGEGHEVRILATDAPSPNGEVVAGLVILPSGRDSVARRWTLDGKEWSTRSTRYDLIEVATANEIVHKVGDKYYLASCGHGHGDSEYFSCVWELVKRLREAGLLKE